MDFYRGGLPQKSAALSKGLSKLFDFLCKFGLLSCRSRALKAKVPCGFKPNGSQIILKKSMCHWPVSTAYILCMYRTLRVNEVGKVISCHIGRAFHACIVYYQLTKWNQLFSVLGISFVIDIISEMQVLTLLLAVSVASAASTASAQSLLMRTCLQCTAVLSS